MSQEPFSYFITEQLLKLDFVFLNQDGNNESKPPYAEVILATSSLKEAK
jgi:hypothetical protein